MPQSIQMHVMYFSQHMPIKHPSHQSQQMPMMYFSQQMPIMHSMQYLQHPATEQIPFIGVTDSSSHSVSNSSLILLIQKHNSKTLVHLQDKGVGY